MVAVYDCEGCGITVADATLGEVPSDSFCATCRFLNSFFYVQPKEEGREPSLVPMFQILQSLRRADVKMSKLTNAVTRRIVIGPRERELLDELRIRAALRPVDMVELMDRIREPDGKAAHRQHMTEQSMIIPEDFQVTYSVECNHPDNRTMRHMSLSSNVSRHMPLPSAVWLVARHLGFTGSLNQCMVYPEELMRGDKRTLTVNVLQELKEKP